MSNLLNASELGKRPQVAKLDETHVAASGSFVCEALAGWADECSFVVYEVDSEGNPVNGSETDWIGTKNNSTLQDLELTAGTDRDYPAGRTYLIATETAGGRNKLIAGLKNTLNDDGTLKSINGNKIIDNSLDGTKIVDNSIQMSKVKWDTINKNGYIELGDVLICYGKINVTFKASPYDEIFGSIGFPKGFQSAPILTISRTDSNGAVGEYVLYSNLSTIGFSYCAGQNKSSINTDGLISWIAIGKKA